MVIKCGVVGARVRDTEQDKDKIRKILIGQIKKGRQLHLVSGGCPKGADRFAEELAEELKLPISIHAIDLSGLDDPVTKWKFTERAYARNTLIANECDILIALPRYENGFPVGGTSDTINKVVLQNKPVICV
jgi:hypothetical protein